MELACPHSQTAMIARRQGVDYVRCLHCDQVFEAEDLEVVSADEESGGSPLIFGSGRRQQSGKLLRAG